MRIESELFVEVDLLFKGKLRQQKILPVETLTPRLRFR